MNICLTGEVEDFNQLNQKLEEGFESPNLQDSQQKRGLARLVALIFGAKE